MDTPEQNANECGSIPPTPPKRPKGFQKGNPGGRLKKSQSSSETLRKAILDSATPLMAQRMATKLYRMGIEGNVKAAKLWLEFTAGKPIEKIEAITTILDPTVQAAIFEVQELPDEPQPEIQEAAPDGEENIA